VIPVLTDTLVSALLAARADDTVTVIELLFNFGLPLVLFILGWVVGGRRERAHLRDLARVRRSTATFCAPICVPMAPPTPVPER